MTGTGANLEPEQLRRAGVIRPHKGLCDDLVQMFETGRKC